MIGTKEAYDIFEVIYPVGIIIELATDANPRDLFGIGEWEQIKDRFILAAGDSAAAGSTGGASTHIHSTGNHTLTINEIPNHYHLTYVDENYSAYPAGNNNSWKQALVNASNHATVSGYYDYPVGGGAAHNHGNTGSTSNMPPYYVAYMWRRVS